MDGRPVHRDPAAEAVVLEDDVQPTAGGRAPERSSAVQPTAEPAPLVTTVTHLLRHGQTEHTPERRFSGRNELALSPAGRVEAAAAADRAKGLGVEVVVASPLRRTRETAEIVAAGLGLPVAYDDDLAELDFGDLEGLTFDEARARHPLAARRFLDDVTVAAPGGESIADVSARVARARQRILAQHAGRTVLVVSHVTPIKLLLAAGLGTGDEVVHRVFLEAASLCSVAWSSDGRASVRLMNDTSHLR
jgi:probable phosphoglycerate mutase